MHLSEIMQFNIKLFNSGVPDESHKEDTSAEELKTTDETVETTEASTYMYLILLCEDIENGKK